MGPSTSFALPVGETIWNQYHYQGRRSCLLLVDRDQIGFKNLQNIAVVRTIWSMSDQMSSLDLQMLIWEI